MKYVVTGMDGGANLRPVPTLTAVPAENLKFATLLDEIAPSATKWKHVRVIDGPRSGKTGHVYFAIVHSEGALRLLKAEAFNWEDSARGKGEEGDDGSGTSPNGPDYKQKVLDMWDALCGGRPPRQQYEPR